MPTRFAHRAAVGAEEDQHPPFVGLQGEEPIAQEDAKGNHEYAAREQIQIRHLMRLVRFDGRIDKLSQKGGSN